jgi:hypothetical protein
MSTEADALDHVAGYCWSTTCPSAPSSSSAAAPGTRARVATPSARRPVAGHRGRGRRSAESRHVARRQRQAQADGSTKTMIFGVAKLIAYVSAIHDARAGRHHHHRHAAGRRHGAEARALVSLKAGDVVTLGIEKLGEQRQDVVAWGGRMSASLCRVVSRAAPRHHRRRLGPGPRVARRIVAEGGAVALWDLNADALGRRGESRGGRRGRTSWLDVSDMTRSPGRQGQRSRLRWAGSTSWSTRPASPAPPSRCTNIRSTAG